MDRVTPGPGQVEEIIEEFFSIFLNSTNDKREGGSVKKKLKKKVLVCTSDGVELDNLK